MLTSEARAVALGDYTTFSKIILLEKVERTYWEQDVLDKDLFYLATDDVEEETVFRFGDSFWVSTIEAEHDTLAH